MMPLMNRHIGFLDGLRGVAALSVVVSHTAWGSLGERPIANFYSSPWLVMVWAYLGTLPVPCFIVLSGLVLSLPIVKHGSLKGGAGQFFKRRAWRILPAY